MAKFGRLAQLQVDKALQKSMEDKLINGQNDKKEINLDQANVIALSETRKKTGKDLYGED